MLPLRLSDDSHLRPLEVSDAEELHALIEANRAHLARWLPWAAEQGPRDTLAFLQRAERQLAAEDGFQAAVVCAGRIAGVAGYHAVDGANRSTSIGYWLAAERQGKGTMTAAVRALVEHAFSTWGLNRVEIQVAVENRRSRAIPERLGFREEGVLRQRERLGERYLDRVLYAMLAADWEGGYSPSSV